MKTQFKNTQDAIKAANARQAAENWTCEARGINPFTYTVVLPLTENGMTEIEITDVSGESQGWL